MCILFVGWRQQDAYPLIVAANRDEFYQRPAKPARFWPGRQRILAGRDLQAGGTWLGLDKTGRFAAVTNYREIAAVQESNRSRGLLVTEFLEGTASAIIYARKARDMGSDYAGFSLLLCDGNDLVYCSNRSNDPRPLPAGQYGLSNHLLDTDWPKVSHGKAQFNAVLKNGAHFDDMFSLLKDRSPVADHELPETGVGREWERILSPIFVATNDYGTRCSTCVRIDAMGVAEFEERSFDPRPPSTVDPSIYRSVRYQFAATP